MSNDSKIGNYPTQEEGWIVGTLPLTSDSVAVMLTEGIQPAYWCHASNCWLNEFDQKVLGVLAWRPLNWLPKKEESETETEAQDEVEEDEILMFFEYKHLKEELQTVSKLYFEMAHDISGAFVDSDEKKACLRKLLESKDAAVRAAIIDMKRRHKDV